MLEFAVIFIAMLFFVMFADYMYVNVGDAFVDQMGVGYRVQEKNIFFARLTNERESKIIPIMYLCMKYMKTN